MKWRVTIETTRTYEFTNDELRELYPDEYAQWATNGGNDHRDWIADCFEQGGPSVFPGHINTTEDLTAEWHR